MNHMITNDMVKGFDEKFCSEKTNIALMNAITNVGIDAVAKSFDDSFKTRMTFSKEIKTSKVTSQNKSGRCWMFAGLNLFRHKVEKKLGLENFELSQSYLMFWDKLEKANYFLECILDTLDMPTHSRTLNHLLTHIVEDGGQWDMFDNLVRKYGVVPKEVMKESFHSSNSRTMNKLLVLKLRAFAYQLRSDYSSHTPVDELKKQKEAMVSQVYDMLCKFLSNPIKQFDFEYTDKKGKYHLHENMNPVKFFEKIVDIDLDDYVSIINAPTADKPYNQTYTVKYLGNVIEGKAIRYLNVDMETMKALTKQQLLDNELVWFGCDVGKMSNGDDGVMSMGVYDYEAALKVELGMSKATRLDYCESVLTHAMVITGVNIMPNGMSNRWKVENSWSDKKGKNGYFMMTEAWFDEFVYEVVINKKHLAKELINAYAQAPVMLDPWDPMGSLAR